MAPVAQSESAANSGGGGSSSVIAVTDVVPISTGYLALSAGEMVAVEYRGSASTDDQGWSFGCSATSGHRGWFADASVRPPEARDHSVSVGAEAKIAHAVTAVGPGYLSLVPGDSVKVEYVGTQVGGDVGWLFGQALATGQKGWFSAAAVSLSQDATVGSSQEASSVDKAATFEPPARVGNNGASGTDKVAATSQSGAPCREPVSERSVATPLRRHIVASSSLGQAASCAQDFGVALLGTRAVQDLNWQYPLVDRERGCFVGHLPSAIDSRKAKKMLDLVQDGMEPVGWELPIKVMNGKVFKVMARQSQWLVGVPGCKCQYSYGGPTVGMGVDVPISIKAREFPPWMNEVMQVVMPLCGIDDPKDWPNCCSMNRYSRDATCDWHADDDDIFKATVQNTSIISLSLGASRQFEFRRMGEMNPCQKFELKAGDLCTMEGMTQRHYQHFLNQAPGPRVSLTWRWIRRHRCGRC